MSNETQRLKKIAKRIEQETSLKDKNKVQEIAEVVDEFARFVLKSYLEEKCEVKK